MMKLGWLPRAAILSVASLLSVVAAAQNSTPSGQLNIPENVTVVAPQDAGVRKATAIVNGEVITGSDIDQRMALIIASQQIQLPPDEVARFRAQVLRNLIDETLQIQAAQQQEIGVTAAEVDNYFERVAQNGRHTPQSFTAYLRSIGSSERSLKRQIRGELAWQRLQSRWIGPFVTVGDDEVNTILARLRDRRGTSEYHLAEIYLTSTPETAAEVQANATRMVQQIRAGANFQAYARQFSEASTAAVGGDLGWLRPEQMPEELAAMAPQMPLGAVSNPIPVPGGYSILYMVDIRQILVADPRDAQLSLMQLSLVNPAGTTAEQAQAAGQRLTAATQSMGGCGRAQEVATSIGAELVSNDQVRVRELPPLLQQMLLNLSVGQTTAAFGSPERISVLVLCGRDDPEVAAEPTFDEVYDRISEQRVARRAQRYLRDLRRDAVVDYR
jgi:peptidyl-prolyl cis-trans isomerase SurA